MRCIGFFLLVELHSVIFVRVLFLSTEGWHLRVIVLVGQDSSLNWCICCSSVASQGLTPRRYTQKNLNHGSDLRPFGTSSWGAQYVAEWLDYVASATGCGIRLTVATHG